MTQGKVYVIAAKRTPIGGFGGSLSSLTAPELGSIAIKSSLESASIPKEAVDQVVFGCVLSANIGQNPARQAAIGAGLSVSVPCTTVNKVCASGMKCVMFAAASILSGESEIVVAGGMESMSNVPYYGTIYSVWGSKYGHQEMVDGIQRDGLFDVYNKTLMGNCAELCAKEDSFTRKEQDDYAVMSYTRSQAATTGGFFNEEIIPVQVTLRGKPARMVTTDDEVFNLNEEKLRSVKPVFVSDGTGTVTAPNASTLSDGASCLILASEAAIIKYSLTPIAELKGWADAALEPERFTIAPSLAVPKALIKAGMMIEDIDYFELNEAFSVVALANCKRLGISCDKVNVHGGAVSMGHPLGCSGSRILVTLIHVLKKYQKKNGCAAICNGGGGASAIVLSTI